VKRLHVLSGLALLLVVACVKQTQPPDVVQSLAIVQAAPGLKVTFSSEDEGTVAAIDERIEVVRERKFKIAGEIESNLAIGDVIFVDLNLPLKNGKYSTAANSIAKVTSVSNGKAMFQTEFYITKLSEQDCVLKLTALAKDESERTELGELKLRIKAPG
jgi:hypothetical protein